MPQYCSSLSLGSNPRRFGHIRHHGRLQEQRKAGDGPHPAFESLITLVIRRGDTVKPLTKLPPNLTKLELPNGLDCCQSGPLPAGLLVLSAREFVCQRSLAACGDWQSLLPPTLESLVIELSNTDRHLNTPPPRWMELPRTLTTLHLSFLFRGVLTPETVLLLPPHLTDLYAPVPSEAFGNLPRSLTAFEGAELTDSVPAPLANLPPRLRRLSTLLSDVKEVDASALPVGLTSLSLSDKTLINLSAAAVSSLQRLSIDWMYEEDLAFLPPGLTSLHIWKTPKRRVQKSSSFLKFLPVSLVELVMRIMPASALQTDASLPPALERVVVMNMTGAFWPLSLIKQLPATMRYLRIPGILVPFDHTGTILGHLPRRLRDLSLTKAASYGDKDVAMLPPALARLDISDSSLTAACVPLLPKLLHTVMIHTSETFPVTPGGYPMISVHKITDF